jgi:hypothetical protein
MGHGRGCIAVEGGERARRRDGKEPSCLFSMVDLEGVSLRREVAGEKKQQGKRW